MEWTCGSEPRPMVSQAHASCVSLPLYRTLTDEKRWGLDCAAELARYENVEDELFLQYYEIDPVDVLQRAFEKSLVECKEEVSLVVLC
jgi:hypothetical protein